MPDDHLRNRRLDSWKDIAAYLGRDIRTVYRWEKERGLPIHRLPGGQRRAICAYTTEIDEWLVGGRHNDNRHSDPENDKKLSTSLDPSDAFKKSSSYLLRRSVIAASALLALAVVSIAVVRFHTENPVVHLSGLVRLTDNGLQKMGLFTDGSELYFSELMDGRNVLSAIATSGGAIRQIPTPFANSLPVDLSPDGKELLVLAYDGVQDERNLWIVPVSEGVPRPVGNIRCHAAAWSPDGRSIAYATGKSIYITQDRGVTSNELGSYHAIPLALRWSVHGTYLRFLLQDPRTLQAVPQELILDRGSQPEPDLMPALPGGKSYDNWAWVRWGPDLFLAADSQDEGHIWIFKGQGTSWIRPRKPAELKTGLGHILGISADPGTGKLFVIGATAGRDELIRSYPGSHEFAPFLPGLSALALDFSPDGRWITYVKMPDHTLWVSRVDGTQARQLTAQTLHVELPRWSPDGRQIAFTADQPAKPWRIFIVPWTGGAVQEASHSSDNQGAPTWSPDGKSLSYANVRCQEARDCAVHRIDLSTGKVSTLPGSNGFRTARWSPDGRFIAALQPQRRELYLFDLATQRWRRLASGMNGDDLAWSRDSRYLYTDRPTGDRPEIVRVPLRGGRVQALVDLSSLSKLSGKFDSWFCLTPDGSLLLTRLLNSSDIYAVNWSAN